MFTRYILVLSATVLLASASNAAEEGSPEWNAATLTGNWGGKRSNLYNKGIDLGFTHKSDILANTSGGIQRGSAWLGHTEARVKIGNCQPSCRLTACFYAAILSAISPSTFPSFSAMC